MSTVPRIKFVPSEYQHLADQDRPLPLAYGQTLSQPLIVARMTELLELTAIDKVLEIGTGSGYQTAILAELAGTVFTVELIQPLAEQARRILVELGYDNIQFRIDNGFYGWPEKAPFDAVIVTAAATEIPGSLFAQLKPGGRMVLPVGFPGEIQTLWRITKSIYGAKMERFDPVRFVPLHNPGRELPEQVKK